MNLFTVIAEQSPDLGGFEPLSPLTEKITDAGGKETLITDTDQIISNIVGVLTMLGAFFFLLYFFIGAFHWITSGGDSAKVQKARDQIINGVLGMIIIVGAYAVIGLVGTIVGINILDLVTVLGDLDPTK